MTIIDHTGVSASDYAAAKTFYSKALAPLGIRLVMEIPDGSACGFGNEAPQFWLQTGARQQPPVHVAFVAAGRQTVRDFHTAALAAGGRDNGAPGLRELYHPHYYGAFVLDLDGNNIEAVCHEPEPA